MSSEAARRAVERICNTASAWNIALSTKEGQHPAAKQHLCDIIDEEMDAPNVGVPHYTIPCGDWGHGDRRERIATAALNGWLASGRSANKEDPLNAALWSVDYADALIAQLDAPVGREGGGE